MSFKTTAFIYEAFYETPSRGSNKLIFASTETLKAAVADFWRFIHNRSQIFRDGEFNVLAVKLSPFVPPQILASGDLENTTMLRLGGYEWKCDWPMADVRRKADSDPETSTVKS